MLRLHFVQLLSEGEEKGGNDIFTVVLVISLFISFSIQFVSFFDFFACCFIAFVFWPSPFPIPFLQLLHPFAVFFQKSK